MLTIINITDRIHRFDVPYKDIYAGVFVLRTPQGTAFFDTAVADLCNDSSLPTGGPRVVSAWRKAVARGAA